MSCWSVEDICVIQGVEEPGERKKRRMRFGGGGGRKGGKVAVPRVASRQNRISLLSLSSGKLEPFVPHVKLASEGIKEMLRIRLHLFAALI